MTRRSCSRRWRRRRRGSGSARACSRCGDGRRRPSRSRRGPPAGLRRALLARPRRRQPSAHGRPPRCALGAAGRALRETLIAVRALLAGERLPQACSGRAAAATRGDPGRAGADRAGRLAEASIRLAGELADEWAPFLWARSRLAEGRGAARRGRGAGETPRRDAVAAAVPVALGPDVESARRLAAWWLSTYATRMGPIYPRLLAALLQRGRSRRCGTRRRSFPPLPRSSRARSRCSAPTTRRPS